MPDRYRMILGALLIIGLMALATAIALGNVQEKSSYGLMAITAILGKIALDFSQWAFSPKQDGDKTTPKVEEKDAR
jgi:hypothetical protein